jgi:hypothetical protein
MMLRDAINLCLLSGPYLSAMVGLRGQGGQWRRALPTVGRNLLAGGVATHPRGQAGQSGPLD